MRIRHMVLFRLREGVARDDPRVVEALAGSAALCDTVPGGGNWRIGADVSGREVAADFGGAGDFASAEALAAFLAHPEHRAAVARWASLATWNVCDIPMSAH